MSFSETVFLFVLALVVFGPKKLPEIARQAGKLLAELRRASNEFKSQIETEIAHLEVEKTKQVIAAPTAPPQGAVASLSLNPASSQVSPHDPGGTLAAPVAEGSLPPADTGNGSAVTDGSAENPANASGESSGVASPPASPANSASSHAAQDSHV